MEKAEQRALEHYPSLTSSCDRSKRQAFRNGYHQAEQDSALTWEDVAILITIYEQGIDNGDYCRYNDAERMKEYSQDILRKFNEIKQK